MYFEFFRNPLFHHKLPQSSVYSAKFSRFLHFRFTVRNRVCVCVCEAHSNTVKAVVCVCVCESNPANVPLPHNNQMLLWITHLYLCVSGTVVRWWCAVAQAGFKTFVSFFSTFRHFITARKLFCDSTW